MYSSSPTTRTAPHHFALSEAKPSIAMIIAVAFTSYLLVVL